LNAAKRSVLGRSAGHLTRSEPPNTPANDRLPDSKPPETHPGHTPKHTDIAAYRCRALTGSPYAGAAGRPARNGIWRRTALPACYPIMGLVNQIRDTRVATVELFHAEPGSNRAPSRDVWRSVRAVPQLTKSRLKEAMKRSMTRSKLCVSYVGWRSARLLAHRGRRSEC
jgi:hypothetical protein